MSVVFEALPGVEVPVGGIGAGLKKIWADKESDACRAVQLNLVVHFGRNTKPEEAAARFQDTMQFAQGHPCRVVVLCPALQESTHNVMCAKVHGECFFGKSRSDTRCVEAVILHYNLSARQYLENQVSVCLSTDMPLYYWAYRFQSVKTLADYHYLLTRSRRVLLDSAVMPPEALTYAWPNLSAVRDLAYTRTLPLRQGLGQFLSRYEPTTLTKDLIGIRLGHRPDLHAEAEALSSWLKKGYSRCGGDPTQLKVTLSADAPGGFAAQFDYQGGTKHLSWEADLTRNHANLSADLDGGRASLGTSARLMETPAALAEAMFY